MGTENSDGGTGGSSPARRPYEPPELVKIELRPEEAVLGACKTMTSGGVGADAACALCSMTGS
jgi:hypothetical protein